MKSPLFVQQQCRVKVLYSSSWFADVITVKLELSLLESAVMQKQIKQTVVFSNMHTNVKVRKLYIIVIY